MTLTGTARAAHTALMTDLCIIERASRGTINPTTGVYPTTWTTIYSGVCRLKGPPAGNAIVAESQAGEAEQVTSRQTLVLPYGSAPMVGIGDRVTVTGMDMSYAVVGQVESTTGSARSLIVESVDVGPSWWLVRAGGTITATPTGAVA